jgi:hypothetical protein
MPVGQTSTEIPLPPVQSVTVLNSSAGIGDAPGAPDVIVNAGAPASLSPQQVGIRLKPGELFTFPLLSAVASGPDAAVTLLLDAEGPR